MLDSTTSRSPREEAGCVPPKGTSGLRPI